MLILVRRSITRSGHGEKNGERRNFRSVKSFAVPAIFGRALRKSVFQLHTGRIVDIPIMDVVVPAVRKMSGNTCGNIVLGVFRKFRVGRRGRLAGLISQ